jgi:hypothetical protein
MHEGEVVVVLTYFISKTTQRVLITFGVGNVRGPFERFVDWRQCAAVMQREAVTVMPSCSGWGNVVVA